MISFDVDFNCDEFKMEHRTFHMNVADVQRFEEKLREAERRLGIKEGVPINYERGGDTAGKLLLSLVIVALLMSLLSRSRTIGGPLRMDTFVRNFYSLNIKNTKKKCRPS